MTSLTQSRLEMMFNLTSGHSSFNWERNRGSRCSIVFVFPEHLNSVRTRDGHRFLNELVENGVVEKKTNDGRTKWMDVVFYWTNDLLKHNLKKRFFLTNIFKKLLLFYWTNDLIEWTILLEKIVGKWRIIHEDKGTKWKKSNVSISSQNTFIVHKE